MVKNAGKKITPVREHKRKKKDGTYKVVNVRGHRRSTRSTGPKPDSIPPQT